MLSKEQVMGVTRHLLTFAGGFAVAKGWFGEETLMEITGALVTVAGVIWSMWHKNQTPKAE